MSKTFIRRKLEEKYGKEFIGNIHITGSVFGYLESPFRKKYGKNWGYERLQLEDGINEGRYGEILDLKWKILDQVDFSKIKFEVRKYEETRKESGTTWEEQERRRYEGKESREERERCEKIQEESDVDKEIENFEAWLGRPLSNEFYEHQESRYNKEVLTTVVFVSNFVDKAGEKVNPFNPCDTINCDFKTVKTTVIIQVEDKVESYSFTNTFDITLPEGVCIPPERFVDYTYGGLVDVNFYLSHVGNAFDLMDLNTKIMGYDCAELKETSSSMLCPAPDFRKNVRVSIVNGREIDIQFDSTKYYGGDVIVVADFQYKNNLSDMTTLELNSDNYWDTFYDHIDDELIMGLPDEFNAIQIHSCVNLSFLFVHKDNVEMLTLAYDLVLS